jgi:hypothetical protein
LAETARFGDDVWPLSPAQLQRHQDRMRLNFALVPAPYRQTAKRLFYAMLSGDLPPGDRRPCVATAPVLLVEVKRFFCWLEQHFGDHRQPPPTLACLTPADLERIGNTSRQLYRQSEQPGPAWRSATCGDAAG